VGSIAKRLILGLTATTHRVLLPDVDRLPGLPLRRLALRIYSNHFDGNGDVAVDQVRAILGDLDASIAALLQLRHPEL
jgi:hypothetical protein